MGGGNLSFWGELSFTLSFLFLTRPLLFTDPTCKAIIIE